MATYRLSREAKADLRQIYRYGFFRHGERQADKYYEGLFSRFDQIAEQPFMYQPVDYIHEGYRRSVYGVHAIYYREENGTIEIVRILSRQDADAIL